MNSKVFIGSVKESKYGVVIGFRTADLETLAANLSERGWVNVGISKSKAGKWYGEVLKQQEQRQEQAPVSEEAEQETPF
jgi:hypothetical protein